MAVADPAAVEDLVAAGLLISDGERVRLSHPLLAVAATTHSRTGERRALHLALADVAGDETLRARHLALSVPAQDADVAGIVAAAAIVAVRRGAAHDAAELAEHALRLTPPAAAEHPGRLVALAQCLQKLGELSRVTELLGPRIGELPAGELRARAHLLLGVGADRSGHEDHLEQALAHSRNDPALRATALAAKSLLLAVVGVERIGDAEALAVEAHRLARSAGPEVVRHAQAITRLGPRPAWSSGPGADRARPRGGAEITASMRARPTAPQRSSLPSVAASARRGQRCADCWRWPRSVARPEFLQS